MSTRPSFILYVTDQHRADFLGCYGHPVVRTPNIDSLADSGVSFDKFYVASPVCMPNRASLMTCRMPSSHDVRMNGVPLATRHVTFVELLRDAGYKTALIGKSHLQTFIGAGPMVSAPATRPGYHRANGPLSEAEKHDLGAPHYGLEQPAFWKAQDASLPTPFYGFDHVELVTGHGDRIGGDYARWLHQRRPDAAELIGADNQLPHDYTCPQAVRTALPEELYSTAYIAERAHAWIAEQAESSQPFFLMVSWPDPHHPFNPPGRYCDMYDPADMPLPDAFTANDWAPPPHVSGVLQSRADGTANLKGMAAVGCTAREAQEAQALTCGMISMIDDAVGRVQAALSDSGRRHETVQVFTSDHGDHLGDHRLLFKGAEQYEQITRVPFIWADPDGPSGTRSAAIGQTIDIGSTVLERARVESAWGMQGIDLLASKSRDAAFIQYAHQKPMDGVGRTPNIHTLRDERFRLSVFDGLEWGELYNLEEDPGELRNLWEDPTAQAEKLRLMERLVRAGLSASETSPMPTGRA